MKVDEVVREYIRIRNELDNKRKQYKADEAEAKEAMAVLEGQMLQTCQDTGVESFKTPYGTAFRTTKDYARVAPGEREAVDEYVLKTGNTQIFTSHLSKAAVKELMEEGFVPQDAGIDYIQEFVVQFRKPTN